MEFLTKQIHINDVGKSIVDQFYIDDDVNVPDSKDDIGRIVMGKGTLSVEEIQRMENYVRVSGKLYYGVLYVTDSGDPHLSSLNGTCSFEEMVYAEGTETSYVVRNTAVEFSPSLIHSRKMSLRAMVEIEIGTECVQDVTLPIDVEEGEPFYKKTKNLQLLQLHTAKKDTYRIKEEIKLPGTKENIGTLLWSEVESRKLDTKLGEDELNISGELMLFCLYESPEGKTDWIEQVLPYNGRVECSGAEESMFHHVHTSLEDIHVEVKMDEDGEMRSIGIEGTLELRIAIYEEENVEVLDDVYLIEKECQIEREEMTCEELLVQNHFKCKLSEQLSLPELREDILQICCNSGRLQIEKMEAAEHGIQIEGILQLRIFYVKENDETPFAIWQGMVPFSYLLDCEPVEEEVTFEIQHVLEQLSVSLLGSGEVEVKAVFAFHSLVKRPVRATVMTGLTTEEIPIDENVRRPGIIGYTVREGEELWDLAKRYHTTMERLREVNGLEKDVVKEGERILIFKENMSIL